MAKTKKKDDTIIKSFRVTMDKELMRRYEYIKEYLGVRADAEVLRILINKFYKDIAERHKEKVLIT